VVGIVNALNLKSVLSSHLRNEIAVKNSMYIGHESVNCIQGGNGGMWDRCALNPGVGYCGSNVRGNTKLILILTSPNIYCRLNTVYAIPAERLKR
jgi:hypothetical protein